MSEYVFNSASNNGGNGNLRAAITLVVTLVKTLAELDRVFQGPSRALKLPQNPWDLFVANDVDGHPVSLGEIVNNFYESGETRDLATFFDALQCYAPTVDQLEDITIDAILRLLPSGPAPEREELFDAVRAAGYEAMQCVVTGGTLVSFDYPKWNFHQGAVKCDEKLVEFDHASCTEHVAEISLRNTDAGRKNITRKNFDATKHRAFPSLVWGQEVADQFALFPSEYLKLAFVRLANLDNMARKWKESGSVAPDPGSMELKGESDLTMQNYTQDRCFRSSTGDMKVYETHVWIDRGNRIHLRLDYAQRDVEIGYVGRHLPTWNY